MATLKYRSSCECFLCSAPTLGDDCWLPVLPEAPGTSHFEGPHPELQSAYCEVTKPHFDSSFYDIVITKGGIENTESIALPQIDKICNVEIETEIIESFTVVAGTPVSVAVKYKDAVLAFESYTLD